MRSRIKKFIKRISSKNNALVSFYYFFISRIFEDEMKQILAGSNQFSYKSDFYVRREVHRVEKALCFKNKKDKYAIDCVNNIIKYIKYTSPETRIWAQDVVSAYMEINKNKSWISEIKISNFNINESPIIKPHKYNINNAIEFNQFKDQLLSRRSVRFYKDDIINKNDIEELLSLACNAPSACNRLPYKFYCVTNNRDKASKIAKCAAGTGGYAEDLSNIIIITGNLSAYENEKDRHAIYIDSSLATMNLIHLLQLKGLGSCCINWSEDKTRESNIRKLINIKEYEKIIMLLSFGYPQPGVNVPYSPKKNVNEIIDYVS